MDILHRSSVLTTMGKVYTIFVSIKMKCRPRETSPEIRMILCCTNPTDFSSLRAYLAADFQLKQAFALRSHLYEGFQGNNLLSVMSVVFAQAVWKSGLPRN